MPTKQIAWQTGSGNITLTYQGQGDAPITVQSDANDGVSRSQTIVIETTKGSPAITKNLTIRQGACPVPVGTVLDYAYTGNVQSVLLPAGRYKLQCWGAQGGSISGSYTATGAKGGYSEGELTLTSPTTVYIFVGGKGSSASTSTTGGMQNGGFNGGGGAPRICQYNSGDENGISYPRPGGGATDISLVNSDVSYSNYRTNRSEASLLARQIVAGGGAGASARVTTTTTTVTTYTTIGSLTYPLSSGSLNGKSYIYTSDAQAVLFTNGSPFTAGKQYRVRFSPSLSGSSTVYRIGTHKSTWAGAWGNIFLEATGKSNATFTAVAPTTSYPAIYIAIAPTSYSGTIYFDEIGTSTETETTSGTSNGSQVGGGTSGGGTNPGTQSSGGGELGKGANMTATNYRYASGGGGGGYYGGGASYNDSTTDKINQSGGGSGYIGTLDNAQTKAGNTSFPSTSGGTETGHSGNGYARITRLS